MCYVHIFSKTCGTSNIDANLSELGDAIGGNDDEILDTNEMDVDAQSVSSDLPSIGGSRPNSRPGSSLSIADSQEVRIFKTLLEG